MPLLGYPDTSKPYVLYTDASDKAIGACLVQEVENNNQIGPGVKNEKPFFFLSHKLSETQQRWSTVEKEAFAIHYALQKLDHYLHNATFVIKTDHKPLKYLLDSPMKNRKIQLWALGISGYNCRIEYIAGTENTCADLLLRTLHEEDAPQGKRMEEEPDISDKALEINFIDSSQINPKEYASADVELPDMPSFSKVVSEFEGINMFEEQEKDPEIRALRLNIQQGRAEKSLLKRHMLIDDVHYFLSNPEHNPTMRLYVPKHYRLTVLRSYRDDHGHFGLDKTFDAIRDKYYWPNLYKEIYDHVNKCIICSLRNLKKIKLPTQETDIPPYPFAKLGLDLSGPYPRSLSGNRYIVGFINLFSGWPEAFAVPDKKAENIAHLVIEEIFPRYGAPLQIITDNGTENENRIGRHL